MQQRSPVLPALGLLSALLLAGCNGTTSLPPVVLPDPVAMPFPAPVAPRTVLTGVQLKVAADATWTPNGETVYALALGQTGRHLAGQASLDASGQVVFELPMEANLAAALTTVDTTQPAGPGCTFAQLASSSGYDVPSFRTASLLFSAKTTSSTSGYRLLQDADLNAGVTHGLIYVDRDVRAVNTLHCVANGRTDDTMLDLDLLKGWNLTTTTDTSSGSVYTHTIKAVPATSGTASLILTGSVETQAPTP